MSENLSEAISLEQAVERMAGARSDKTTEAEVAEGNQDEEVQAEPDDNQDEVEEQDNEAEGEPEEEPSLEIVFPEGKRKLTASEIKDGVMFKADYTRKTMAVAEERKAVEARAALLAERQQQLDEALQVWAVPLEQEPNWQQLATTLDPQDYNRVQAEWMVRQRKASQAREEYRRIQEEATREAIKVERQRLLEAIPEFRDENVYREATVKMAAVGQEYGFTTDELGNVRDHRMVKVLNDLAAYNAIKKGNAAVTKRVTNTAPTLKPGAKTTQAAQNHVALQKQQSQLRKTGSLEDAAALLRARRTS